VVEQAVEESAPQLARPLALEGLAQAQRHQAYAGGREDSGSWLID
jgi:hypothetical protein